MIFENRINERRREKGEAWTHILQRAEEGWLQHACTSPVSCGGIHLDFQTRSSHTHGHVWRILQGHKSKKKKKEFKCVFENFEG